MKKFLGDLEKSLDYKFKDIEVITQALTHKSYINARNNERLEFLGDAVLDLVVGEYLYKKFEQTAEGELSKLRSSLVSEKGFQKLAAKLNLGEFIYISDAEDKNKGREKYSILSNTFEALMGAIYLESGIDSVKKITISLLEGVYPKIDLQSIFKDYKTTLQELTQSHYGVIPEYTLIKSSGPDHKKEFEIGVSIQGKAISRAKGMTKKEAEQGAAQKALEILKEREL